MERGTRGEEKEKERERDDKGKERREEYLEVEVRRRENGRQERGPGSKMRERLEERRKSEAFDNRRILPVTV